MLEAHPLLHGSFEILPHPGLDCGSFIHIIAYITYSTCKCLSTTYWQVGVRGACYGSMARFEHSISRWVVSRVNHYAIIPLVGFECVGRSLPAAIQMVRVTALKSTGSIQNKLICWVYRNFPKSINKSITKAKSADESFDSNSYFFKTKTIEKFTKSFQEPYWW